MGRSFKFVACASLYLPEVHIIHMHNGMFGERRYHEPKARALGRLGILKPLANVSEGRMLRCKWLATAVNRTGIAS